MNMRRWALLSFVLLLAGCATTQPISSADKQRVGTVYLNSTVPIPPNMYYLGPGSGPAFMFGAVGAIAAAPAMESSRANFQKQTAAAGGATIDRIVLEEVRGRFAESGKFAFSDSQAGAAATLSVTITQYGFSIPNGFSSKLVPMLAFRCELKDAAGKALWSDSAMVLTLGNPVEAMDPDLIRNSPQAREEAWRGAARALAKKLAAAY
jgi:hypothetical protein